MKIFKSPTARPVIWFYALILLFQTSSSSQAQTAISDQTLKRIKEATVLIQRGQHFSRVSGTGFLIRKDNRTGYIVTNDHLFRGTRPTDKLTVNLVFNSGTSKEKQVKGEVCSRNTDLDLALIRFESKDIPTPIGKPYQTRIRETMPLYMFGFPFGKALSATEGNPTITVGKGSVSSIRRDQDEKIKAIQLDGDLNPGNSGGPVVDPQGKLIGIAQATVLGTQISFAIPADQIEAILEGQIISQEIKIEQKTPGVAECKVEVRLSDPLHRLSTIAVMMGSKPDGSTKPVLRDMKKFKAKVDGDTAVATFAIKNKDKAYSSYWLQSASKSKGGAVGYTKPQTVWIDFSKPAAVASATTAEKIFGKKPKVPDDDWLGGPAKPPIRTPENKYKPILVKKSVLGTSHNVQDAEVTPLTIDTKRGVPHMVWSSNADYFYVLNQQGLLRQIQVPTFVEIKQLDMETRAYGLALSRQGLLVSLIEKGEIWVLDEESLAVKKVINTPGISQAVSSPNLDLAFVPTDGYRKMNIYDLRSGRNVKSITTYELQQEFGKSIRKHPDGVTLSEFGSPAISPDGQYFMCIGFECLHRMKIQGHNLIYEEMGARFGKGRIEISPDSKYVAMPTGGGNRSIVESPKLESYGTYVFRINDLQKPIAAVNSGSYPRALAYDKKRRMLYAQNYEHQLITCNVDGTLIKKYQLTRRGDSVKQFLTDPKGRFLLMMCDKNLLRVTFKE